MCVLLSIYPYCLLISPPKYGTLKRTVNKLIFAKNSWELQISSSCIHGEKRQDTCQAAETDSTNPDPDDETEKESTSFNKSTKTKCICYAN